MKASRWAKHTPYKFLAEGNLLIEMATGKPYQVKKVRRREYAYPRLAVDVIPITGIDLSKPIKVLKRISMAHFRNPSDIEYKKFTEMMP